MREKRARKLRRGFTAMEVIMAIVVVGILAALAVPRFDAFHAIKFENVNRKVVGDLRYAQQIALSQHTNSRIVFSLNPTNTYSAQAELPTGSGTWVNITDPFTRAAMATNFRSDPQYRGINITAANFGSTATLRFDWQGIPQTSAGANLTSDGSLTLTYKSYTKTFLVTPQTGKVRLQ